MNKVCFISVYFGKQPAFFRPFFESCSWNSDFDWLFIYDDILTEPVPSNIRTLKMTLHEFIDKVNFCTGLKIEDLQPYKVCDFRPAFGEIFKEHLEPYEFWGICDTDMLLGKLSNFITERLLKHYDKIYTMGHLSLVRNEQAINAVYKYNTIHSRKYQNIFLNPISCIYDEYAGFTEKYLDLGYRVYKEKECADINCFFGRLESTTKFVFRLIQPQNIFYSYCKDTNSRHQIFILDHGRIFKVYISQNTVKRKEYSYIHKLEYRYDEKLDHNSRLIITQNGYVNDPEWFKRLDKGILTPKDFDKYNRRHLLKGLFVRIYLYIRLSLRQFRKKYFPRFNEM